MSIIVYDGDKTVAVDRQATKADTKMSVQKGWLCDGKEGQYIVAVAGDFTLIKGLVDWYANGADSAAKVRFGIDKGDFSRLLVVDKRGARMYESKYGCGEFGHKPLAIGSGSDLAYGALHMGATAQEAAECACEYSIYCGMGIDVLTLEDGK